jgi:hypothetical protein
MNNQQMEFLKGMMQGIKKGTFKQIEPITMNFTEKHDHIKYQFQVVPAGKGIAFKTLAIEANVESPWKCWENEQDIERFLKTCSFI